MTSQLGDSAFDELTIETKCWEGDWRELILGGVLESRLLRFPKVKAKTLLVNNVQSVPEVIGAAQSFLESGLLSSVVSVEDHADEALAAASLSPDDLGAGYVYSIAELVGIHRCETEFLLHLAGDVALAEDGIDWVLPAIGLLCTNPRVVVGSALWNGKADEAEAESLFEDENFWYGYGFSDQFFLIEVERFRQQIYQHTHPDSERYPAYGGQLFEKRIDAWMRREGLLRATTKHASYTHPTYEAA